MAVDPVVTDVVDTVLGSVVVLVDFVAFELGGAGAAVTGPPHGLFAPMYFCIQ
jgi:hypothetical protein